MYADVLGTFAVTDCQIERRERSSVRGEGEGREREKVEIREK